MKPEKKIQHMQTELKVLKNHNNELNKKVSMYESRKLGRLLTKFYEYSENNYFFKVLTRIMYFILYIPIKILEFFVRNPIKEEVQLGFREIRRISNIIKKSSCKKVVFFIAPIEWNMILKQRPQHIAKYIAKENILYFYIEKASQRKKIRNISSNLYTISSTNYNFISKIAKKNLDKTIYCQFYSAEWTNINKEISTFKKNGIKIIFEYVDEISSDISGCEIPAHIIERFENSVKDEKNTYIVATASKLYEDISFYRKNHFALIPNGVEQKHFSQKFTLKDLPFQMLKIYQQERPVIGYYGAIASWMDFDLLKFVAKSKPDYNIVLIGLDYDGSLSASGLEEFPNIHVIPPVQYKDLPRFAHFFDVCMIPFKVNDVTKSTSPIKLFEYMAMGKPIVTTDMPECRKYRSVMVAQSKEAFVSLIEKALGKTKDKTYLNLLRKEALENTWKERAKATVKLLST